MTMALDSWPFVRDFPAESNRMCYDSKAGSRADYVMSQSSITKDVWHVVLDFHRGFKVYSYVYGFTLAAMHISSVTQVLVSDGEARNVSNYTCRL